MLDPKGDNESKIERVIAIAFIASEGMGPMPASPRMGGGDEIAIEWMKRAKCSDCYSGDLTFPLCF